MEFVWLGIVLFVFVAIIIGAIYFKNHETESELKSYEYLKKLEREPFTGKKIFCIGNSYADDSLRYLPDVLRGLGQSGFIIANVYIGGCSLQRHWLNACDNANAYEYRKFNKEWTNTQNVSLLSALKDEDWDVVVLQQQSANAGQWNTYTPYLQSMIEYVKTHCPNARIAFNMTWAYPTNSKCERFSEYDNSSEKMYNSIASVMARRIESNFDIDFVIPTGTAIQNARTVTEDLFRDDIHLNPKGRFLASLAWAKELYALDLNQLDSVIEEVSIDEASVFIKSAESAYKHPYVVIKIE